MLSFSLSSIASEIPKFSELKNGERIDIIMNSSGCFHSSDIRVSITFDKMIGYNEKFIITEDKLEKLGWSLTEVDRDDLDTLFEYYASEHKGASTTVETISLTYLKNRKVIHSKDITDDSGDLCRDETITSLDDIIFRCFHRHKKQQEASLNIETNKPNQQVEAIVTTPVEQVGAQSTQPHP